jgi:hypothetical protein
MRSPVNLDLLIALRFPKHLPECISFPRERSANAMPEMRDFPLKFLQLGVYWEMFVRRNDHL